VLPKGAAASLSTSHRNALRLLKLVNTLLDFSRIEAGRVQASYEPSDLCAFTAELASNFRSLFDKAGLRLIVDCRPESFPEPAYVDRDMWEKIVLNLVSNAFKFTLDGEIEVGLAAEDGHARLTVRDTGVGIAADELPRMFERFHRIEHNRGRTHEGTGIGLALVQELVKLHGGTISATSTAGRGSAFTVTIPLGKAHLDPAHVGVRSQLASTAVGPSAFVEEALRWLPDETGNERETATEPAQGPKHRVLIADDNADMRSYLARLLAERYEVETVANGAEALSALGRAPLPDLVLTDVMMPVMDGFELLQRLRAAERTRTLPVIMLSARAGEDARVEGLHAGADDYLVKPFTARELTARVRSQIAMAQSRRETELSVRAAQERLRLALEASGLGAWEFDPKTGELTTDARYREIFGFPSDLPVTVAMAMERVHPEDRQRMVEALSDLAEPVREREYRWECRLARPDGSIRWLTAHGKAIAAHSGPDGGPSFRIVGNIRDVTEEKQSEEAFRETQKLESLGLLAGGIAHDFNNLLTGVIGGASLLAEDLPPRSPEAELVKGLREAAERMSRLTSQMLAYSGRGHFVIESLDLSSQVTQIMSLIRASALKNVELRLNLAERLPAIDADVSQLQQVVMNLVINAAEAVGGRAGYVEISTHAQTVGDREMKANLARQAVAPGEYVVLTVSDNGSGMDPATYARIFDPFFTTKFTGRGLGLSSVLGIVRGHKGLLTVKSRVGEGTTFRVFFPAAARPVQEAPALPEAASGEGTILVVDDEEVVRRVAAAALMRHGYKILTATNGLEALEIYARAPDAIDLVLLDMTMPVMGGEEALRRLATINPSVVVVAMSGFDEREAQSRFGSGIAAFVHKPFSVAQLGASIAAVRRATK
jgi:PAS domain S-box-containing protein